MDAKLAYSATVQPLREARILIATTFNYCHLLYAYVWNPVSVIENNRCFEKNMAKFIGIKNRIIGRNVSTIYQGLMRGHFEASSILGFIN